jgi:hypothetical protein
MNRLTDQVRERAVTLGAIRDPSTIQMSQDASTLFVGGMSGDILICPNISDSKIDRDGYTPLRPMAVTAGSTVNPVRSVCDIGKGWVAVGMGDGSIHVHHWPGSSARWTCMTKANSTLGAVSMIFLLGDAHLLVSHSRKKSLIYPIKWSNGEPSIGETLVSNLPALACGVEFETDVPQAILVTERCEYIVIEMNQKTGAWVPSSPVSISGDPAPGYIMDYTVLRHFPRKSRKGYGLYIATEVGTFVISCLEPGIIRVDHSSFPEQLDIYVKAITYSERRVGPDKLERDMYLADRVGDVHLVRTSDHDGCLPLHWVRTGATQTGTDVYRAVASTNAEDPTSLRVCRANRDGSVILSVYQPAERIDKPFESLTPDPEPNRVWQWLTQATIENLRNEAKNFATCKLKMEIDEGQADVWLADLFEYAAEVPTAHELLEFLRQPNGEVGGSIIVDILRRNDGHELAPAAISMWTQTVLGCLARMSVSPRSLDVIGVIRWLKSIEVFCARPENALTEPQQVLVQTATLAAIDFVAKWGLHYGMHVDPYQLLVELANKIHILSDDEARADWLVSRLVLHEEHIEVLATDHHSEQGTGAFQVQLDDHGPQGVAPKRQIAVAWRHRTEIRKLECTQSPRTPGRPLFEFGEREVLESTNSAESNVCVLGTLQQSPGSTIDANYLFIAPNKDRDHSRVVLWQYKDNKWVLTYEGSLQDLLPPEWRSSTSVEYVCSAIEIKPGFVLVGLRGIATTPRLLAVLVDDGRLTGVGLDLGISGAVPEGLQVPIWALARDRISPDGGGGYIVVIAGCDDGQVLRTEINPRAVLTCAQLTEVVMVPQLLPCKTIRVGRLGSPVWSTCHRITKTEERIFAGTKDGTIVAWIPDKKNFSVLWATNERSPIARLHQFDRLDAGTQGILAVTHAGQVVFFLDTCTVEGKLVPGERLGRAKLKVAGNNVTVFASDVLRKPGDVFGESIGKTDWPLLITASADHRLTLFRISDLPNTDVCLHSNAVIHGLWRDQIGVDKQSISARALRNLRLSESLHVVSDQLMGHMIMWLMGRGTGSETLDFPLKREQRLYVPRNLRGLVDLTHAWSEKDCNEIRRSIGRTLGRLRRMNDRENYDNVVRAIFQVANATIDTSEDGELETAARMFYAAIDAVEEGMDLWVGTSTPKTVDPRINAAKALLDAPVLAKLLRSKSAGAGELLMRRGKFLSNSFERGDEILTLETARAANLTLIRASILLDERPSASWEHMRKYFQSVAVAAARTEYAGTGLDDALSHELSRAFALGMYMFPEYSAKIAQLMSQSYLSDEFRTRAVKRQLNVLGRMLRKPMDELGREWYLWATRVRKDFPEQGLSDAGGTLAKETDAKDADSNDAVAQAWGPWQCLLDNFMNLTRALRNSPANVDLEWIFDTTMPDVKGGAFGHSERFWNKILPQLRRNLKKAGLSLRGSADSCEGLGNRSRQVSPRIVRGAPVLKEWAHWALQELENAQKQYRIYLPESALYEAALIGLRDACAELRRSVGLQRDILKGVLDHGLLEAASEHAFEFYEIAHALEPNLQHADGLAHVGESGPRYASVRPRGDEREHGRTVDTFAEYITQCREKAEEVPRALLNLRELLEDRPEQTAWTNDQIDSLCQSVRDAYVNRFETSTGTGTNAIWEDTAAKTLVFFVVAQLMDNHDKHGPDNGGKLRVEGFVEGGLAGLSMTFPVDSERWTSERLYADRIGDLRRGGCNVPMTPHPLRPGISNGVGLYLANLAAAMAGCEFQVDLLPAENRPTQLRFRLGTHRPASR